jgi:DNA replication protein DnaC
MTVTVDTPDSKGEDWTMDNSERLRAEVARRAERDAARPQPQADNVTDLVLRIAAKHGVDPTNLRPATDAEMAAKEQEIHRERIERQAEILVSRLPIQYQRAVMPRTAFGLEAMEWLKGYRSGQRGGLVLLGPTGTGKTWVAAALARLLLTEDTVPVTFIAVPDFLEALRPSSRTPGVDPDMMQYALAPLLVLDDLGAEGPLSAWGEEQLWRLANERNHNNRPTIVTSNMTGPEIRERYNDRIVERLFAGSTLITLSGGSLRPMPF